MNIKNWSTTAASNNATPPDGFPEGQSPSTVNDSAREMMAALRTQHENAEWIDYGYTLSYISATSFVLDGDRTTQFHAGRRVRAGVGAGTVYGTILSASYSTKTGITISLDSGNLDNSLTYVSVGIISKNNTSWPDRTVSYAVAAGSATFASSASAATNATNINMLSEDSSINASVVSLSAALQLTTINVGSVTSGDRVFVSGYYAGTKGGTAGENYILVEKYTGTAGVAFLSNLAALQSRIYYSAGSFPIMEVSAIMKITSSGTLTLQLRGLSTGSTTAVDAGFGQIYYVFLKKQ